MDPIQSGDRAREKIAAKSDVDKIADAVLYEGYILYPYRPTAVKNQQRFNFGVLAPRAGDGRVPGAEVSRMRIECLVRSAGSGCRVSVRARFLQLVSRQIRQRVSLADGAEPQVADQPWADAGESDESCATCPCSKSRAECIPLGKKRPNAR